MTISEYEIMQESLELKLLDESLYEHRQAFLNFVVRAEKSAGKGKKRPVYKKFVQFFDYEKELEKLKTKKEKKSRFAGIGKFLKNGR